MGYCEAGRLERLVVKREEMELVRMEEIEAACKKLVD